MRGGEAGVAIGEVYPSTAYRLESQRMPRWLFVVAALVVLLYLATEASLLSFDFGFPLDDSWIHLTFARNLAAGDS